MRSIIVALLGIPARLIVYIFTRILNLAEYCRAVESNIRFKKKAHCLGELWLQMPIFITGAEYMHIGDKFFCKSGTRLECIDSYSNQSFSPVLNIGNNVSLNYYCHIGVVNQVSIGNDVLIGSRVLIADHSHGNFGEDDKGVPFIRRPLFSKGPIIIEDNVWLCDNSVILGGVIIGTGSVVAANAVVTSNVPPYCIVAGVPAKVVKRLD